jgi:enterochelin esterase-like enzyme/tetratricopeptide (TPR) repeat protein
MTSRSKRLQNAAILVVGIALLFGGSAAAQEDGSPVRIGTYRILHSKVLNEERTLLISLPEGYDESPGKYPVLFILYGGQVRGYFAEAVHTVDRLIGSSLIPPMIIVGVKNVDRYRDNLPVSRGGQNGGAGAFLRFFTEELIPFIETDYRAHDFRALLGPQAGAAFSLYALMEKPGLFKVNIVTNPFWARSSAEYLLERSRAYFNEPEPSGGFLFVTCNTSDDNEMTMALLDSFESIVAEGKQSDFTLVLNPLGEEAADDWIPPTGLKRGLKAYFAEYKYPDDKAVRGIEDLTRYYDDLSMKYGYEVDIPEFTLIIRGHDVENEGNLEAAQVMYEYVRDHYPHDLNSYHSLAQLHRKKSEYDLAVGYYEQFLERLPEPGVQRRLDGLKRYMDESAAYEIEMAIVESGVEAGVAMYRESDYTSGKQVYFDEAEFNSLGYAFIARGMIDAALAVFRMNVEMHPESANAFDSLGEACLLSGDTELAIENYTRSLELNPENDNARRVLEDLGGGSQ